ncbi:ABCG27 [Arabidopsis thaliana]|nr:ABCG27 [Arabidopsis thaliana]
MEPCATIDSSRNGMRLMVIKGDVCVQAPNKTTQQGASQNLNTRNNMEMGTSSSSSGLVKAKSETLAEALKSSSLDFSNGDGSSHGSKQHVRARTLSSPSYSSNSKNRWNTHIRKAKSAHPALDLAGLTGGAALSRASSASLGLSFSFTGFTVPHEEIIASERCSNDDILEDIEAATSSVVKFQAEPTFPIYLKFIDITYKVTTKGMTSSSEKSILNGISGSAYPGELLALMGPSGSGKTTLLNALGGRFNQQNIGGSVSYNDKPYSKHLKTRIGFVTQDDVLFPHLTVKETLTYTALLRLPKTLTEQEKEQRAASVIQELGLERCQDTMIGGSFVRGVSGGERKRVCIGNEIMTNPSLLLLDEPTSSLDSTTALKIVQMLHCIAKAGKTIVTTIHQPSSRLFHRFDKLVVLSRGSLLYFGKASEAMSYFSSIGCSPLLAMNPAEFLLDLVNGNMNDISVPSALKEKMKIIRLELYVRNVKCDVETQYLEEAYKTQIAVMEKMKLMAPVPLDEEVKLMITCPKREWGLSWWEQYCLLSLRGIKERRHDYFSWLRVTQVLSTAIILGLLWWQSDITSQRPTRSGLLFFIAVFWGFFPVFTAIFTFPQERAMLSKERESNMYRLSAYFVARTTSDLPLDLILPVLFLVVVYFMAGLRLRAESFFLSVLTVFLCIVAAQGLGLAIGASLMDLKKATTLASVTVMTFMLAGGYFVKKVPFFIAWIRFMSFNYHTYKLLVKVQYEEIMESVNGEEIESGLKEVSALVAMIIGYRLVAYFSLRRMKLHSST